MSPLKRTLYWTAPVLITASLGFAGVAFAASGSDNGSGSSGSISHEQSTHGTNSSAGTPSETMPMSPECKKDPSSSKCMEEHHSASGMNKGDSGMSNSKSGMTGNSEMNNGKSDMNMKHGSSDMSNDNKGMSNGKSGKSGYGMGGKTGTTGNNGGGM